MRSVSVISHIQEFVIDKAQALNEQVTRLRQGSVKSARVAVQGSAESLKGLKNPVRLVARSGVRLSTVSQTAVQELIELQSEALTAAITEFALRLERAARAASVGELVRDQVEMLPATRARVADDAGRVLQIVTSTGREIRDLATETFERVTEAAKKPAPARRRRRKAKKATRRSATRSRKAAA
jgi:phasin family protein